MLSGSQHRHREGFPILAPAQTLTQTSTAQPRIGTERLITGINGVPAGWSSTLDTVHGKYCKSIYCPMLQQDCLLPLVELFTGISDSSSHQHTRLPSSGIGHNSRFQWHEWENSHLGGAQGMPWCGFCLQFVFCLSFKGLVFDRHDNALEE